MPQRKPRSNSDVVSASEIASFTYRPEQWRLAQLGNEPENVAVLSRGESFHAETARVEVRTRQAFMVGVVLVKIAGVLFLLAFLLGR